MSRCRTNDSRDLILVLAISLEVVAAYTSEGCVRMGDASENGVWVGNHGTVTRDKFVICTGERGWSESRPLPHQVHHSFHVCTALCQSIAPLLGGLGVLQQLRRLATSSHDPLLLLWLRTYFSVSRCLNRVRPARPPEALITTSAPLWWCAVAVSTH